jgi:peptide deformylase
MIIINDQKLLRTPCQDVLPEEVATLKAKLEFELAQANAQGKQGIGLAAPQIGIFKKMAIIRLNEIKIDLVNCQIEKGYDPFLFTEEGCLSFPGKIETTRRFQEVYVTHNLIEPSSFVVTGLAAIAVQHELDHLNGILLEDRAIKNTKKIGVNDPCPCGKINLETKKPIKFKNCCRE